VKRSEYLVYQGLNKWKSGKSSQPGDRKKGGRKKGIRRERGKSKKKRFLINLSARDVVLINSWKKFRKAP